MAAVQNQIFFLFLVFVCPGESCNYPRSFVWFFFVFLFAFIVSSSFVFYYIPSVFFVVFVFFRVFRWIFFVFLLALKKKNKEEYLIGNKEKKKKGRVHSMKVFTKKLSHNFSLLTFHFFFWKWFGFFFLNL